jgi:hypothetical protein
MAESQSIRRPHANGKAVDGSPVDGGAGRSLGVDAFLAPPLDRAAARGSRPARRLRWLG